MTFLSGKKTNIKLNIYISFDYSNIPSRKLRPIMRQITFNKTRDSGWEDCKGFDDKIFAINDYLFEYNCFTPTHHGKTNQFSSPIKILFENKVDRSVYKFHCVRYTS